MVKNVVDTVLDSAETTIKYTEREVVELSEPVRKSVLKRFPIFFTLFVTFGVSSVFYGFERILDQVSLFHDHPWILLCIGVVVLVCTGTLYKKL